MSWTTAIWSATIATCLTLVVIHLAIWYRQRQRKALLYMALTLAGVAGIALVEFLLMRAGDSHTARLLFNWANLWVLVIMVGLVGFLRFTYGIGSPTLAAGAIGLRAVAALLVLADALGRAGGTASPLPTIPFLGETVHFIPAPQVASTWYLNEVGNFLFFLFILHAILTMWRGGRPKERASALRLGAGILFFTLAAASLSFLINHGILQSPYLVSLPFLPVVMVLILELARQQAEDARSKEITLAEMVRLRHRLHQADRVSLLGHLSSALVHELGQPLGAILRNAEAAELLLDRPGGQEQLRQIIQDIRRDDRRAMEVISRMRELFDRRTMERRPVHLLPLAREVVTLLQLELSRKGVEVELRIPSQLPALEGDPVLLQQVLLNLLGNALEAMDDRGGWIRLEAAVTSGGIEMTLRDNGRGVPPDIRDCLFDPFCTSKKSGMGIGLAISRTIVEAHGGRIWLGREAGPGATFHLLFPLADREEATHG